MSIQRKKLAFIKSIREQQLNNYFTSRRQEIEGHSLKMQQKLDKVYPLFNQLPHKIIELVQQLDQNFPVVGPFLSKEVKQFCSKMIGSQNVEWCYFVYAINRLLVSPLNDKNDIRKIVNESFLPILDGVQIQLKKSNNSIMQSKILNSLLQYCFRIGGFIQIMHQLQQNAMINTMKRLWDHKWQFQEQIHLLQTSLTVFHINFDKEDEQNITKQWWIDAELSRIKIIKLVFYEQQSQHRLQHILRRMMSQIFEPNPQLLNIYLRLLVTFTKYTWSAIYIYPLLKHNILHIISTILYLHQNYDKITMIFTLRLLNNMLMNETHLSSQILQELMISNVIKVFHKVTSPQIQSEAAELLINLTLFMNDQAGFIRDLIYLGATEIIIDSLRIFSQQKEDALLQEAVSCINVMLDHNSIEVKKVVRQNQKLLRKILEEQINISSMLESILQSSQIQEITL